MKSRVLDKVLISDYRFLGLEQLRVLHPAAGGEVRDMDLISDCQVNVYNLNTLLDGPPKGYGALRFDPNNTCNLQCVYCHNHRSGEVVESEAFSRFLQEKVIGVGLFQVGCIMEPTLDKRLADLMLMIARSPARPRTDFMLQTNGVLLHRHDQGKFVEAGLSRLSVSMDAADTETQKSLRSGTSLDKVLRNISFFTRNCPATSVEFITTVTTTNVDRLEKLVDMGRDLGVRRFIFRELFYYRDNDVVDHARMPSLILKDGQFAEFETRMRDAYGSKVEMHFAANEKLDASAREMAKNSQFVDRDIPGLRTLSISS